MGNLIKSFLFWFFRFFECLLSKRYFKTRVIPEIKNFFKQIISIYFWIRLIRGVFFIILTICTIVICFIPGIILFLLDKINLKPFLLKLENSINQGA